MKKISIIVMMLFLLISPPMSVAGDSTSTSGATGLGVAISSPTITAATEANISLTQISNVPAGQGRWFVPPVQPYSAPVLPYLGPWTSGSNIIEDLRVLPEVLTLEQAEKMYNGGVSARINRLEDFSYRFDVCKLAASLPMKELVDKTGKTVKDKDGKPILVPDESKFKRVAYIFLQGNKKANTVDVVAKAAIEAMNAGANTIYLVKKVTTHATSSSGWGIGFGGVTAQLGGSEKDSSVAGSTGTGYNSASAEPAYKEGMVVMAIQDPIYVDKAEKAEK